jgi:hypothetical protein
MLFFLNQNISTLAGVVTTIDLLDAVCPIIPEADGRIAVNSTVNRADFLYSCCMAANSCFSSTPDECSQAIIDRFSAAWSKNCAAYKAGIFYFNSTLRTWTQSG